jgi:signal transduction histidine kinase/Na+/proline symporter
MNILVISLTLFSIGFACLTTYKISLKSSQVSQDIILSLALVASIGVLLAMGTIEMVGRYGYSTIFALFAFSLVFTLSPLVLFPIRRLSRVVRFATSIDFLTFRYRGRLVAITSCIATALVLIPIILAHILAFDSIINMVFDAPKKFLSSIALIIGVGFVIFRSIKLGIVSQIRWIMSAAGMLLMLALVLSTWTAVESAFGGFKEMDTWVLQTGQQTTIKRLDISYSLFIIFLAGALAMPTNFNILVSTDISEHQSKTMSWTYPLLVLLACIPAFPMLWSGIALQSASAFQEYLYSLPLMLGKPIIASIAAAAVLLISVAICSSLVMLLTRTILNSIILPVTALSKTQNLTKWINYRYLIIALGLLLICILLSNAINSRSITDLYLVGLAGLAQLTPGMLAAVYLPKVNRKGFLAGLFGGMFIWFISLAAPLVFGDWQWQVPLIDKSLLFGMQAWEVWSIEALILNITLCTLFSIFTKMSEDEQNFAVICMADNVYIPIRVEIKHNSIGEIRESLRLALGEEADIEVQTALDVLGVNEAEIRPGALRQLRDSINASLNLRFGVLTAHRIMQSALPLKKATGEQKEDIFLLESVIDVNGHQLTGRQILDNLPIGIISIDQNGEILKWNSAIAAYTNINEDRASGSSVNDLPDPWKSAIIEFISSRNSTSDNVRLIIDNHTRWFNFQKSQQQVAEEINHSLILLVEEKTESVVLVQKSIDNERLASMGRLAAGVAHEIGNPVTGIACVAQNLEYESQPEQISQSAQQILSQTNRINKIVESLINFSRGGELTKANFKKVNLQEAGEEAINLLTLGQNHSNVTFQCTIDQTLNIFGDYHQLIQIFLNLLSNSRDASPKNSTVTMLASVKDKKIIVTINDLGTGIAEDLQSKLFEPFVTSKDIGEGTGLGLWVVFNLVKSLGAQITIFSPAENSQRGTTVKLIFDKL